MMGSSDNLFTMVVVLLAIDVVFLLANYGMTTLNPNLEAGVFNYADTLISDFDTGGYHLTNSTADYLPAGEGGVDSSGGFFIDIFRTAKSWLVSAGKGLVFLGKLVSAPVVFMGYIGAPSILLFAIGALWYGALVFLIVNYILGRGG